jgi:phosphoribosylformimino-5-aminoimidazole carboxamide ribotide isomerase
MFEVVPSIDLRDGKIVRLQQGDYQRQLNYDLDPIETARSFQSAGAGWMHIVDLDGAKQGAIAQLALIEKMIKSCQLKVQVGGGIRSSEDVRKLVDVGAQRVVIGTKAIEDWPWFERLTKDSSLADRLVLALDAKEGKVATRGWTQTSDRLAIDIAKQVSDWPLAGILYTDIAKDGMLSGPNLEQTRLLAQASAVPVIASGGVAKLEDIRALIGLGIWGAILGRSLHDGKVNLREAIELARSG